MEGSGQCQCPPGRHLTEWHFEIASEVTKTQTLRPHPKLQPVRDKRQNFVTAMLMLFPHPKEPHLYLMTVVANLSDFMDPQCSGDHRIVTTVL